MNGATMRIALAAAVLTLMSSAASAQRAQNWSFEDGTLQGWIVIGDAFANQPTYGNNIEPRRPGERPGSTGDWWIGSYENRPSASAPAGTVQGDGPVGYLISPPFRIEGESITFSIGGGHRADEVVALLVRTTDQRPGPGVIEIGDGLYLPAMFAEGSDIEFMSPIGWDVRGLRGLVGRILIADTGSGPWDHINVDNFRFSWINDALAPSGVNGVPTPAFRKQPPVFRPSRPLPMPPGNFRDGNMVLVPPTGGSTPQLNPPTPPPPGQEPAIAYPVGGGPVVVQPPAQGKRTSRIGDAIATVLRPAPVYVPPAGSNATGGSGVMVQPPAAGRTVVQPVDGSGMTGTQPIQADPIPPPAAAGRYRLVATAFHVRHQTVDDMLERDGPGDEIFVRADILFYRDGTFQGRRTLRSVVYGRDSDVRAGSGHQWNSADDRPGGLVTNDVYPPNRPRFDTTPSRIARDLPMVLWEGELQPTDTVLVIPSIWEWDSNEVSPAEQAWDQGLNAQAPSLRFGLIWAVGDPNAGSDLRTIQSHPLREVLRVFDDGTRPIGATRRGGDFRSGPLGLNPPGILLTTGLNEAYLSTGHTVGYQDTTGGAAVSGEIPLPPGAILLQLDDPRELEGQYDLDLKLERTP